LRHRVVQPAALSFRSAQRLVALIFDTCVSAGYSHNTTVRYDRV
jgi:hypothetical protein